MAGDDILWKKVDEIRQQQKTARNTRTRPQDKKRPGKRKIKKKAADQVAAGKPGAGKASKQASNKASELASYHASMIEEIRKVVKQVGRESAFLRLTAEEKRRLVDIVYSFRRQGTKTSENELLRIALNFLLDDYEQHGKESMLVKVLEALHA